MSDTQDQSHFTVEDAGTTTDPADLANSGVGHAVQRDEDPVESADEVVRATDGTATTTSASAATGGATTEQPATTRQEAVSERRDEAVDRQQQAQQEEPAQQRAAAPQDDTAATAAPTTATASSGTAHPGRPDLSALADEDLGHVFDQTNGVIERADGDSDGSGESDVLSGEDRFEEDPMFDDAAVHGDGEVSEARRTGD